MRLLDRLRGARHQDPGKVEIRSVRQRQALLARLASDLGGDGELAKDGGTLLEVQPLIRVTGSASYERFQSEVETAWRRQGGAFSTRGWPATIDEGEFAAVLLPLAAGRVGPAVGKQPRAIMVPQFSRGRPIAHGRYDDIALGLLATWLGSVSGEVRVAPPVVELIQGGHVVERRVLDFGLEWHLPRPDGV